MRLRDIFGLAMTNLLNRRLRSWLTILGIVVGVAAVVSIISIGEGLQQSITTQFSRLGTDTLTITPGYTGTASRGFRGGHGGTAGVRSGNLTVNDVKIIKTVPEVEYVNGMIAGSVELSYLDETAKIDLQGVDSRVWKFMIITELAEGRYLTPGDSYVAVIGSRVARSLFKQDVEVGRLLIIGGQTFRVVGVLKESTSRWEGYYVFVPRETTRDLVTDVEEDLYTSISVKASKNANMSEVSSRIEQKLLVNHQVSEDEKDFTIWLPQALQERLQEVTQTLKVFLGAIATVSLLVGGIGIANTMFMSVMEQTRQIGILKALGATNGEVMTLFLIESSLMGIVGGIFGVFVGFIASGSVSMLGVQIFFRQVTTTTISPELVVFALIFSLVIGMISGVAPARRAAQLQPVEALRYE
ncbi:MAG: ABC transporter permease [Candidatus Hydrothermarchaeota archaeon]|jgi:putative ABC transport system permease protein|nr:ABC transporter permease [Candidatus Hydrothermarchaeota archaeon]